MARQYGPRERHAFTTCEVAVRSVTTVGIVVLLLFAALFLAGCSHVTLSDASPKVLGYSLKPLNDGTEQSQRVELRVRFDRKVVVGKDARRDLVVTVNGQKPDGKTTVCSVAQDGGDTLLVKIAAAPGVSGSSGANYFALYDGALAVTAADASQGLAHVTAADGHVSAWWNNIKCRIPSGLKISVSSSVPGSASAGRAATATFRVVQTPQVRVVSWLELEPQGKQVYVHNHEFLTYDTPSYAAHLAESLQASFAGEYELSAQGDTVTVTAAEVVDGQVIKPAVCEGDL